MREMNGVFELEPAGYSSNLHIRKPRSYHRIDTDSPVIGGSLIGRYALVADYLEIKEPYERAYSFLESSLSKESLDSPLETARLVSWAVDVAMPFGSSNLIKIIKQEATLRGKAKLEHQDKVGLSRFIYEGGNCHHQAMLGASLLEMLQVRHDLGGAVRIHSGQPDSDADRHVWVRYTMDDKKVVISKPDNTVIELDDGLELNSNSLGIQVSNRFWLNDERIQH